MIWNGRSHDRTDVHDVKSGDTRILSTVLGAELAPQRPRFVRERAESEGHILEPEWSGTRALVRIGHGEPRFVGYQGALSGPRELYDAIVADARCETAIIDGVLVDDWKDESDLEVDDQGNAYTRQYGGRQIFAAFDLLEVDGEALLDVPLLERRRHLEGVLAPSQNVRLTPYVTRGLRAWRDTLLAQGFRRVVLKNWNSAYAPGKTNNDWLVIEKLKAAMP
jgi:bifunctional non-homologous end joining protein LigD